VNAKASTAGQRALREVGTGFLLGFAACTLVPRGILCIRNFRHFYKLFKIH